ncbi:hypothetical protein HDF15_004780 [Granulicella mallensis]|uniref:Uncharacterized protein n=1 Tax=Granulicella mallensis TaxID=940614 RepID=A0A7W7ZV88_9BACT|nr:hypothetical protein [Granulicella mallensis]
MPPSSLLFWLSFRAQRVNLLSPALCLRHYKCYVVTQALPGYSGLPAFAVVQAKNGRQQVHSLRSE